MATSERRRRSCSTSTPPTTRSTASKKVGFFHGYYDSYCYLPLYIFCGRFLLGAKLRPANIDGAAGAVDEVAPDRRPHPGPLAEGADRAARRFRASAARS